MDRLSGYEAGIVAGLKKSGRYPAFLHAAARIDQLIKIAKATGKTSPKLEKLAVWNEHLVPAVKRGMEKPAFAATAAATSPIWGPALISALGTLAATLGGGYLYDYFTGDDEEERIRKLVAEQLGQPQGYRPAASRAPRFTSTAEGNIALPRVTGLAGKQDQQAPKYDFKNFKMPPQMEAMVKRMGFIPAAIQHMFTPMKRPEWVTPEVETAFKKMFGRSPMEVLWEEEFDKIRQAKQKVAGKPGGRPGFTVDEYLKQSPGIASAIAPAKPARKGYREGFMPVGFESGGYVSPLERQGMPKEPFSPERESERKWWQKHQLHGRLPGEYMAEEEALNVGKGWKTQREERLKKIKGLF